MKGPLYTAVLRESWQMMWQHKKLFWFGLLAAFVGSASVFDFLLEAYYQLSLNLAPAQKLLIDVAGNILTVGEGRAGKTMLVLCVVALAALAVFLLLSYFFISAQGALIGASAAYLKDKKRIHMRTMWDQARERFWPLLAANVFRIVVLFGLLVTLTHPLTSFVLPQQAVMGKVSAFISIVVIMLVGIFVSLLTMYAGMYIVLKKYSVGKSFRHAWSLFVRHWLVSLEVGLLMFALNIGAYLLSAMVFMVTIIPIAVLTFLSSLFETSLIPLVVVTLALCGVALIAFIWAAYTTWVVAGWTSMFLHMDKGSLISRILHWTRK